jgi:hypothetical protein
VRDFLNLSSAETFGRVRRFYVFQAEADADETRIQPTHRGEALDQPKYQRRRELPGAVPDRTAVESALYDAILDQELEALREARRKIAGRLHLAQMVIGEPAFTQRRVENIGGGDRVLNSEVDADATTGDIACAASHDRTPVVEAPTGIGVFPRELLIPPGK